MAYFKKKQMKANGKWYPVAVTIGRPVGTDTIAKKLADLSSLSTGDVKSVLDLLGGVLGDYMNQPRPLGEAGRRGHLLLHRQHRRQGC